MKRIKTIEVKDEDGKLIGDIVRDDKEQWHWAIYDPTKKIGERIQALSSTDSLREAMDWLMESIEDRQNG